ncbi:glycosyltransferase like 2 family protein [Geobacillus kaustophilus]|uniref:Glycosyltransferase like 2 family protein n=1 Tax=Geobacillus kaustophilus TaxID=1462 RepID=A0A0D8BSD5_GEOKU|nr:glycosyltransferase family 2 protein [Geobacillus kaustophilus]KJE27071.1 glycosyltransferase like 2 family protein [Geobacillus kaustophilus]
MVTLDIVIVNWNSGLQLKDCLSSIIKTNKTGLSIDRVVVVDNNSQDESISSIIDLKKELPLEIIYNEENKGFGAACNQGALNSKADYLLFLNPDTMLFENSLINPLSFMEKPENKKIGIIGVQLLEEDGTVNRSCSKFPKAIHFVNKAFGLNRLAPNIFPTYKMETWDHNENRQVDQVLGAFFLVRRELFEKLNGFDERFFVYFEEVDFSYRAFKEGYYSYYLADAQVFHKGGGVSEQIKATRLFYSLRSRIQYSLKNHSLLNSIILIIVSLTVELFSRSCIAIAKGSLKQLKETLQGYSMLFSWLFSKVLKGGVN